MNAHEKAEQIRAAVGISDKDLPVDLELIAKHLDLEVYYADFDSPDISGMIIADPERVPAGIQPGKAGTVFLKRGEYPPRSRFTLAHEIGHLVLGHLEKGGVITDRYRGKETGYGNPEEGEANSFAGELLMPKVMFTELWHSRLTIEELTIIFGVSAAAIVTRAKVLHLKLEDYTH